MISFNRRTKIFVCKDPTDMRASYDTLFSKAKNVLSQDPFSGHLFLFINRLRTSVKCLFYDGTGLVLLCKRLERGTFSKINSFYQGEIVLTQAEFALFFEGANLEKRFIDSPREIKKEIKKSYFPKEELHPPPI
jgi:transposase